MKYPQITQITQISSCASGHANRTRRAGGVPQVKGCLPAAAASARSSAPRFRRKRHAAKRGLYLAGGNQPSAEICVICVICGS
jgi:hypothetical protein